MKHENIYLKEYFPFLGENGRNPSVEVYLPYNMYQMNRQDRKRPCVIIAPGGGYSWCSQHEGEPYAMHFLGEGFNAFVLSYSVTKGAFPAQLREVAAVLELIYKNADAWNCDTSKILICGSSAGGHLAAHYSNAYACREVREVFPESKPVAGTVLCYPVITADPAYAHLGSFQNLTGKDTLTDGEIETLSCERLVTPNTPPAFIWHTAEDGCVPVMNSFLYADALRKAGVPFELHIYPYGAHGRATCDIHTCYEDVADTLCCVHLHSWLSNLKEWLKVMGFKY